MLEEDEDLAQEGEVSVGLDVEKWDYLGLDIFQDDIQQS